MNAGDTVLLIFKIMNAGDTVFADFLTYHRCSSLITCKNVFKGQQFIRKTTLKKYRALCRSFHVTG